MSAGSALWLLAVRCSRIEWMWSPVAGVRLANGTLVKASVVHLCAGPEASTRILLNSGVGDPDDDQWATFNIPHKVPPLFLSTGTLPNIRKRSMQNVS